MQVYQIRLKVYLLKDISLNNLRTQVTYFLDSGLNQDQKLAHFHQENRYKNYCYDLLFPHENSKVYKKDKIYTLTIRTIDPELADFFLNKCVNCYTEQIKGLTAEIRIIPRKHIDILYTLTPVILKDDRGYWRGNISSEEFESRMKVNLIKKWNAFENTKIDEDFELYNGIEFLNQGPILSEYKGIKLLGDKLRLHMADNVQAQQLAYMSLGTGLLEMNSRGFGYVNYSWL